MNKLKKLEAEERECYIDCLAKYIANRIQLHFKYFGNEKASTYNQIFESSFDTLVLSDEEINKVYEYVDSISQSKSKV